MRAIKYIYFIGMFAVLTFVSCHGPAEQKAVTSQELRELYKEVLTAAISNPDSAMMMIERLRQRGADRLRQTDKKKYRIIARLFGNNYYLCTQNYVNNESYGRIAERQL